MEVYKEFLEKQNIIIKLEDEKWEGNLEDYNIGGIWALFGKKSENNDTWFCLQVGQTENIADEIKADKKCLEAKKDGLEADKKCLDPTIDKLRTKHYVNQFGKKMLCYYEYPSCREQLYNEIREEYENLIFICVYKEDDIKERTDIEKYFAWNAYPLYWRNGGPYKEEKEYSESMLDEIKDKIIGNINLNDNVRKIIDLFFESSPNKQMD